jgi:hypothetical protein
MEDIKLRRGLQTAVAILGLFFLQSCSTGSGGNAPPPNPMAQSSQPSSASTSSSFPSASRPIFYDFSDVPVPQEMNRVASDSFVFQSGPLTAGLLTLKGFRVDKDSLVNFFQVSMPREHWKQKGGFNSGRTVLIFEKPDKICVINIYEKMVGTYTYVEVYVAPITSGKA